MQRLAIRAARDRCAPPTATHEDLEPRYPAATRRISVGHSLRACLVGRFCSSAGCRRSIREGSPPRPLKECCRMSAHAPRHLRARSRRLSTPLRWLLSLALLTPLVAGLAGVAGITKTPAAVAAPGSSAAVAVRFALAQLGKPYRWGADGPRSFDCSGLVQTSYRAAGSTCPGSRASS